MSDRSLSDLEAKRPLAKDLYGSVHQLRQGGREDKPAILGDSHILAEVLALNGRYGPLVELLRLFQKTRAIIVHVQILPGERRHHLAGKDLQLLG